jgi:hypothetical protein
VRFLYRPSIHTPRILILSLQGLITPPLVQNTGYGAYVFFAVFCVLAGIWTYFFVPETKGRTLEQMDHVFKDNSSVADQAKRHAIEVELIRAQQEVAHREIA